MKKIFSYIVLVSVMFSLTGCATVLTGTNQKVPVSSNPAGATVSVDGAGSYTTPTTLTLQRKMDHVLVFTKQGYRQADVRLMHVISGAVAGNILLGGLIGWGVDALTGAQYKLAPETVNVVMEKEEKGVSTPSPIRELTSEERLNQLKDLHDKKMITDTEYEANRQVILHGLSGGEIQEKK